MLHNGRKIEFSKVPDKHRFEEKTDIAEGSDCWLWQGAKTPVGFGSFRVGKTMMNAHRACYMLYIGDIPKGMNVAHTCGTRHCVNPDHLCLMTHSEALRRRSTFRNTRKTAVRGENSRASKLKESDIFRIREIGKTGLKAVEIAKKYSVCPSTISDILRRKTWKHV